MNIGKDVAVGKPYKQNNIGFSPRAPSGSTPSVNRPKRLENGGPKTPKLGLTAKSDSEKTSAVTDSESGWPTDSQDESSSNKASPVLNPLPSHLFVELTSLEELSFPTSSSTRIKVSNYYFAETLF